MPEETILIHNKQTGGVTRVPEYSFNSYWKDRGWERHDLASGIDAMTHDELDQFATDHGVTFPEGTKTKEQKTGAIRAVLSAS